MGNFKFPKFKILTSGTTIDATGKTLIISTHGALTGHSFDRPYPTVVQFCTPKMTSLRAALTEVIAGRVTGSELESSQKKVDDHSLSWFEHDPNDNSIIADLAGTKMDVLVMRSGQTETLANVLSFCKTKGYLYPNVLCVFCRVTAEQFDQSGAYIGGSTTGKVHAYVSQANQHKVNATAIALELRQKKGFK